MNLINRPLLTMVSIAVVLIGCDTVGVKTPDRAQNHSPTITEAPASQPIAIQPVNEKKFNTIWDRIRSEYALPTAENSAVAAQIRFYTNNKTYFYKITQQSEPYLHFVVSEMQANNMPMELALLPFIESSYNPAASSANNVGMWQLGSATARNLGLKQNTWYDGRKDVVASTEAAIKLLKNLYARFDNDWLLAIAAYNAGDGAIQQALEKNRRAGKPTDFWSLPLNKTTQGYVPQLLALSKIVAHPDAHNFKLYPIADLPYFVKVNVGSQINLADAAKNSATDATTLKKLNAGFNGWLTDPHEPRNVLVPVDAAASFRLQLDSLPKIASTKWQEHQVKTGDSLDSIAKKYSVNADKIKTVNNLKSASLTLGQRLQIPLSSGPSNTVITETNTVEKTIASKTAENSNTNYHIVKSGENLWSIAREQRTSINELAKINNLGTQSALKPGQKLVLTQAAVAEVKQQKAFSYTIKAGDTLGGIAAKYDTSVKQIMAWNKITDETNIRPNQVLIVMADANSNPIK